MIDCILKIRNWRVFGFKSKADAGSADVLLRTVARHPDASLSRLPRRAQCGRGRPRSQQQFLWYLSLVGIFLACISSINAQAQTTTKDKPEGDKAPAGANPTKEVAARKDETPAEPKITGQRIRFADGSMGEADEVFKLNGELWVRHGSVTERLSRSVSSVETMRAPAQKPRAEAPAAADNANPPVADSIWVVLKGGARMKVDEVTQDADGAWCRRGNFSVLITSDRIERIETESASAQPSGGRRRDWTTGNAKIDQLIRA